MLTAIRQWVIKTMMKNNTGVVQTLPKRDLIELNTQITAQRLMQNGVDPEALKNVNQVENAVNAIESRPPVQQGIRSTKSAKVMDMEGKEIPKGSQIMGGKEVVEGLSDKEFQDLRRSFRMNIAKNNPEFNQKIADQIIKREIYQDLSDTQRKDFLDNLDFVLKNPRDGNAQGGRAGFKGGSYDRNSFEHKINELKAAYKRYKKGLGGRKGGVMTFEQFAPLFAAENFAAGGRAGFAMGLGPRFLKFLNQNNPVQAYKKYLQSVKDRAQKGDMKSLAPELGAVTASGIFINRRMQDVLKNMKEKDMENSLENFKKELEQDDFYKERPELKDKILENYTEKMFGEKRADGGRAGFKDGLLSMLDIKASGSKSGKQQIQGAPEGITADSESVNAIIKADIPISQKINLLADLQYGKGRTRIEKDNSEIFLDEGGFKSKNIGAEFNRGGEGLGGKIMYNLESGDPTLNIKFKKSFADGGRANFDKGGMTRRSFLKILGGLAAIPIVGKFLKPIKTAKGIKSVPIIKTDNVPGKPEWFDALVNKVIIEGDDVTKRFATADRQAVHQKTLDDGSVVRVTEDVDDGAVRVEYENEANVYGDEVLMEYKKPLPDEGDPRPSAEFTTAESGPVGRQTGPDDFDIDVDEVGGTSISDLDSDVSKLKEYATGKKPTMKEFVQNKKRRDKASAITNDIDGAASDAVIRRQGDYDPSDYDDYASGGIARMLGE